ncbi:MAG: thiol-disulfide oxidoreductase DCC family protein [Phaeodactylibacter sp.]|nr:thiol-disulfide oxidoreductase DCC family protein [Phaeodactylibacter sp.]
MKTAKQLTELPEGHGILLFDGVSNLCNGFVQFVIPRDPKGYYKFVSLQSETGKAILEQYGLSTDELSTVVLVENGKVYTHSGVALKIVKHLSGLWPLLQVFWIIPRFIRDAIYRWVARNRYKWFGKREACWMPTPELQSRFMN